jgi:hypothetical protein
MMLSNYTIIKARDAKKYSIFENKTQQVIETFGTYDEAKFRVRTLRALGFVGWTPSFVLKKVAVV